MFEDFYFVVENSFLFTRRTGNIWVDYTKLCVLQSVLKSYDNKNRCFVNTFPDVFRNVKKLMIDSGGYNILKNYPDYPFTVSEYNDCLNFINPDSGVCLDYNTASLIEKIGDRYEDRLPYMRKTIDNYIEQFDMDRNYELIIPIQGNSVDEKLLFVDMLGENFDLKQVEYWGIGGGGITNMDGDMYDFFIEIRRQVCNYLNRRFNNPKIHIFGGNLTFMKSLLKYGFEFTSVDTWSWGIPMKKGRTFDDNLDSIWIRESGLTMTEAKQRCILKYIDEIGKIMEILESNRKVMSLV